MKKRVVLFLSSIFITVVGIENTTKEITVTNKHNRAVRVQLRYYFDDSTIEYKQATNVRPKQQASFYIDHESHDCNKLTYMWLIAKHRQRTGKKILYSCPIQKSTKFEIVPDVDNSRLFQIINKVSVMPRAKL